MQNTDRDKINWEKGLLQTVRFTSWDISVGAGYWVAGPYLVGFTADEAEDGSYLSELDRQ